MTYFDQADQAQLFVDHHEMLDGNVHCILVRLPGQIIPRGSVLVGIVSWKEGAEPTFTPISYVARGLRDNTTPKEIYTHLLKLVVEVKSALGDAAALQLLIDRK